MYAFFNENLRHVINYTGSEIFFVFLRENLFDGIKSKFRVFQNTILPLFFFFGYISTKYFVIENFISRYSYIKKERKKESMLNIRVKKKTLKKLY